MRKKRVLILTADAGFGHRSAANAIANAFAELYSDRCSCLVINPVERAGMPAVIRDFQLDYDRTVRLHPSFYHFTYRASNPVPVSWLVNTAGAALLIRPFQDMLREYSPDGIVSTYHIYNTALRRAMALNHVQMPLYSVITDLAEVHRLWLQPGPDRFFVASEQLRSEAIRSHIDPEKITVSGIPVDTRIARETREKSAIRQELGWDPNLSTLLAVGSRRVHDFLNKLDSIDQCHYPLQLVVVAGGDDELYRSIQAASWKVMTHCYNQVENIPVMLRAADLLISKAGGLIVSEALAAGLPLILVDAISGQETGNVQYVRRYHAGVAATTPTEVQETVCKWLDNDQRILKQYAKNAQRIGRPDAAYLIAREFGQEIGLA